MTILFLQLDAEQGAVKHSRQGEGGSQSSRTSRGTISQRTITAVFDSHRKNDSKSREAKELNEAVTRFICSDQVRFTPSKRQDSSHWSTN